MFSKPLVYQKFGVQEYNIVHQDGRIIQYGLVDGSYDIIDNFNKENKYKSIVFEELEFSLEEIFE